MPEERQNRRNQHHHHSAEKTRSVTFRVPMSVVEELQAESDQKEVALNVLVNQILRRHVSWDRYMDKAGMLQIPKTMLTSCLERAIRMSQSRMSAKAYRDEFVKYAAAMAFELMKESVLFMRGRYDIWAVLEVLEEYMKASGVASDHKKQGSGLHTFVVQHDMGENWSLFIKELLTLVFQNLAGARAEISATPHTTVATVTLDGNKQA